MRKHKRNLGREGVFAHSKKSSTHCNVQLLRTGFNYVVLPTYFKVVNNIAQQFCTRFNLINIVEHC